MNFTELIKSCGIVQASGAEYFRDKPEIVDRADHYVQNFIESMPRGSGFNMGVRLRSWTSKGIELTAPYHRMDEVGGYDGWVTFTIKIVPTFDSWDLDITMDSDLGLDLVDFVYDTFARSLTDWLNTEK